MPTRPRQSIKGELLAPDGQIDPATQRQLRARLWALGDYATDLRRANLRDESDCAAGASDLHLRRVELRADNSGNHAFGHRRRNRPDSGIYRVEEGVLAAAAEDGGADVGGPTVGREPGLRVGDLVAAVLIGQIDLPGKRAGRGVPPTHGSGLPEVRAVARNDDAAAGAHRWMIDDRAVEERPA